MIEEVKKAKIRNKRLMEENDEVAKDMTNTLQNQLKLIQLKLRQTGAPPENLEDLIKETQPTISQ